MTCLIAWLQVKTGILLLLDWDVHSSKRLKSFDIMQMIYSGIYWNRWCNPCNIKFIVIFLSNLASFHYGDK